MIAPIRPDGVFLRWDHTPEQIINEAHILVQDTKAILDTIGSRAANDITFENTIKELAQAELSFSRASKMLGFYQSVSPNKAIRDASIEAEKELSSFAVEWTTREDLYRVVKAYSEKNEVIGEEDQRYVDRQLRDFKRSGLHLDEATKLKVKALKQKEATLQIDYDKNVNESNVKLTFSKEELAGLPDDFISGLDKEEGTGLYILTLKYPHYIPLMKKCSVSETRRKMEFAYNTRCVDVNIDIIEQLGALRHEMATLMGYASHAAYIAEARMVKTPETIVSFLDDLKHKVAPLAAADMKTYLTLKEEDCKERGLPFDGKVNQWDVSYYAERLEEAQYTVDHDAIKEYFPMANVTAGLLGLYQTLLGLTFTLIPGAETWHEDVNMYSVVDTKTNTLLGYFYLDLYPRDAKYGHAACFDIQDGCVMSDGTRQLTVAACVTNFTKPQKTRPSLLLHSEVETFFHEFGHVMHQICAQTKYELFSGTNVERDFVEAPSQMLENWCWEPEALRLLSSHYQTKEKIPEAMIAKLLASRRANAGYRTMRQIFLATLDQTIHRTPKCDTFALMSALTKEMYMPYTPGTNMVAAFAHVARGYDAQYYGYLWSEVYSFDMFSERFLKEGILSPAVGQSYRQNILL
eukprot:Ihof_evm8s73 gene=Ihof_evmTU8s73